MDRSTDGRAAPRRAVLACGLRLLVMCGECSSNHHERPGIIAIGPPVDGWWCACDDSVDMSPDKSRVSINSTWGLHKSPIRTRDTVILLGGPSSPHTRQW